MVALKKGNEKDGIRDAIENGNHAADMQQDDACENFAEDGNSSQVEMMLQEKFQSASSSKKLKSFHYKDDKAAGHAMEHGNDSVDEQRSVALNSQYNLSVTDSIDEAEDINMVHRPLEEHSLLVIEACAGTATLSAVLKDMGFEVLPIDFGKQRNLSHLHIVNLDLRQKHSWEFLAKITVSQKVFHFHGAPPCGTASKAREIAMSSESHGPPQVRSDEFPLGFPWLQGVLRDRVESANSIYIHLALFCLWLQSMSIGWSIENPGNSYIWMIHLYKQLEQVAYWVQFHACCHGSTRKKLTGFLTNVVELTGLEATCQGDHPHDGWGLIRDCDSWKFATSKEAAYPVTLCQRIGSLLEMKALKLGLKTAGSSISSLHKVRASVGSQPKISKFPTLISEFGSVCNVISDTEPSLNDKRQLTRAFHNIPAGSKLLRSDSWKGEKGEQQQTEKKFVFGVYRSQMRFVEDSMKLQHPFDCCVGVPDDALKCLAAHLQSSPLAMIKQRLNTLLAWKKKAVELKPDDDILFAKMTSGCRSVLKGKRISLMKYIAGQIGWPDLAFFDELVEGFKLTGVQQKSGIFESDCKPPVHSEEELMEKGKFLRPALWGKISSEPLQDFSQPLWEITVKEAKEKEWLKGPLTYEEINFLYDKDWLPVRRFAVFQKDKWRPIDDFSENGVNGSFGSMEKVDLRALDETVWISVAIIRALKSRSFSFRLSDGSFLEGKVNDDWFANGYRPRPLVKTLDLKSAYKQLALNDLEARKSVICLKCPDDGRVYGFVCKTLPFGAVASVLHFNRFARFLKAVFLRCGVVACNYFDDYPIVELSPLSDNTEGTLRAITKLLGITVAEDKDESFSSMTDLLGVTLDLTDQDMNEVRVCNKLERKKDLTVALDEVIKSKIINPMHIPSLFGRLQFAESQILGRAGGLALKTLRRLETRRCNKVDLDAEQITMFGFLRRRLNHAKPRSITTTSSYPPVLVFTDGSFEPTDTADGLEGVAAVGGVIFVREASHIVCRAYGCILPKDVVKAWARTGKKHLIGQTELYAVVLARKLWASYIDNSRCIFFIDHGGVMSACIKGNAKDAAWRTLLLKMEEADEAAPALGWFTRVPSASNIADGPSRGSFSQLGEFVRDEPSCILTDVPLSCSENLIIGMGEKDILT